MKTLFLLILPTLILSCSSTAKVDNDELKELRVNCIRKKSALDCAQYAYEVQSTNPTVAAEYNKRACALGEESACFNNNQTEKSSIQKNMTLLQSASSDMFACYYEAAGETKREEEYGPAKETKTIKINVKLAASGAVKSITVERNQVESVAVSCIKDIIGAIEFEAGSKPQSLDYSLTVPKAYL
jgi:hypothetical protein